MSNDQIAHTSSTAANTTTQDDHEDDEQNMNIRDIHTLTPPRSPPPPAHRRETWETTSHQSSLSIASSEGTPSENFTTMSREFNALVLAGSTAVEQNRSEIDQGGGNNGNYNLGMIGEEEETNPLAIVPDNNLIVSPRRGSVNIGGGSSSTNSNHSEVLVQRVKKEEVEAKISAWQNAKIAKINNRFKREDSIITGWENEQVQKSTSWMKKIERKLEEKRARAVEKKQNDIAKTHRKAEERRASAEARRGTKEAKVYEIANLMKAVGRAPSKRTLF